MPTFPTKASPAQAGPVQAGPAQAGIDFLAACTRDAPLPGLLDRFYSAIAVFGFTACAGGAWGGVGRARAHRFYFNTWPQDWLEIYNSREYFHVDPMVLEARRRMEPYTWSDLAESFEARTVVGIARDYGWREVMGVPMHGPFGYQGLVTLASKSPVPLDGAARALLRAMATAIHDRCHAAIGFGESSRAPAGLTDREIECMQWVAAGKTDVEIGLILSLSKATAHFHVEQVKRKLDVRTRAEAIALMTLDGLI